MYGGCRAESQRCVRKISSCSKWVTLHQTFHLVPTPAKVNCGCAAKMGSQSIEVVILTSMLKKNKTRPILTQRKLMGLLHLRPHWWPLSHLNFAYMVLNHDFSMVAYVGWKLLSKGTNGRVSRCQEETTCKGRLVNNKNYWVKVVLQNKHGM